MEADPPSKESYRLSLIKKLRKLSPMLQKREQAPKCWSNEEGKIFLPIRKLRHDMKKKTVNVKVEQLDL
jgi:hypothetical protein